MPDIPFPPNGRDIRERAFRFACAVVGFCQALRAGDAVSCALIPQLLSCTTSIAAMLAEARSAESRRDFISKCAIGLKEANEAATRLRLCEVCQLGPPEDARRLWREAEELARILATIVKNAKRNLHATAGSPTKTGER